MKNLIPISIMVLFLLIAGGCRKKDQKDYAVGMGGLRTWTGEYDDGETGLTTPIADTFGITIIDKTTIAVRTDTLHFSSENSASHTYIFQRVNKNTSIGSSGLTYNYVADSASYSRLWMPTSNYSLIQLHSQ